MLFIHVQCPRDVALTRYISRKLPGRLDDDEKLFHWRYHHYLQHNDEIVAHYRAGSILVEVWMAPWEVSPMVLLIVLCRLTQAGIPKLHMDSLWSFFESTKCGRSFLK